MEEAKASKQGAQVDLAGQEIKGYKIMKPIGQGKFSIVYKAERTWDGLPVALKLIKIFDIMDPKARDKCLKEVQLLQSLDHEFIIKYLDSFIENNELFIAVEWAEKGDLKKIIRRHQNEDTRIQESKVWEYIYQMASGLEHMHDRRIMHRDLKPANILISQSGILKLGDLGLGRSLSTSTFEVHSRVGTPLYMSPEVLQGSGYDMKSDVWSLGCVSYQLCCLKSPFKKEEQKMSLYDLFKSINKGEYPPINQNLYSQNLRMLIDNMIKVNHEERFDIKQVVNLCEIQRKQVQNKPRIDPFLIMDDIMEKLRLLDYESNFCKPYNRPPISRIYFAYLEGPVQQRLQYFYDLCYWLMSFSKAKMVKILPIQEFSDFQSNTDMAKKVLQDVKSFGMKVPETITPKQICSSYGDAVCHIINDLLNRELIRRDFRFEFPDFTVNAFQEEKEEEESEDEEEQQQTSIFKKVKLSDYLKGNHDQTQTSLYDSYKPPSSPKPRIESAKRSTLYTTSTLVSQGDGGNSQSSTNSLPLFNSLNAGIIESTIDANQWRKEYERVKNRLFIPEATILEASNEDSGSGGDFAPNPQESRLQTASLGIEYQDRLRIMKHHLGVLQEFKSGNGISVFEYVSEGYQEQLDKIRKNERKLNQSSSHLISALSQVVEDKKTLMQELTRLRDKVKHQIDEFDTLTAKTEAVQTQLSQKAQSLHDDRPLKKLKEKINQMRRDLRDNTVKIELSKAVLGRNVFQREEKIPEEDPNSSSYYDESFAEFNV